MLESGTKWTAVSLLVIVAGGLASVFFALQGRVSLAVLCGLVAVVGIAMLAQNPLVAGMLLLPAAIIVPLLGIDLYRSGTIVEILLFVVFALAFTALAGLVMFGLLRDPEQLFDNTL